MTGPWLVLLGRGRGDADVDDTPYVARGHGREETFQRNIADWSRVEAEVARIAGLLALDLAAEPRPAVRVVVKVRYAPFITETHGVTLSAPSSDPEVIAQAAADALGRFTGRRPVRLLGVRAEFGRFVYTSAIDGTFRTRGPCRSSAIRAGLEGSGWRSAVTVNPERSYSRRHACWSRSPTGARRSRPAFGPQPVTASIRASPTPRPRACGRTNMEMSSTVAGHREVCRHPRPGLRRPPGPRRGTRPPPATRCRQWSSPMLVLLSVGRAEGIRGIPQCLQPDVPPRLPVGRHCLSLAPGPCSMLAS